jgi:hypothetical protein
MRLFLVLSALSAVMAACTATVPDGEASSAEAVSEQASIVFPLSGPPSINGRLIGGGTVKVSYPQARLTKCRDAATWDLRLGTYVANTGTGTLDSLLDHPGGRAADVPVTIHLPLAGERLQLWVHNTAAGCEAYDSNDYSFPILAPPDGIADGAHASPAQLASLVSPSTASIVFPASGDPVVNGRLQRGGLVFVVYALERLPKCRAYHDGYPFWATQIGMKFSNGTQQGDDNANPYFTSIEKLPGHAVRIAELSSGGEHFRAVTSPVVFQIPQDASDLQVWAHNWNPGGPVSPCADWDSLGGANYRFAVEAP